MNVIIGLQGLKTAKQLTDTSASLTYGPLEAIEGLVDFDIEDTSGDAKPYHGDNVEKGRILPQSKLKVEVEVLAASQQTIADFYGHTVTGGVVVKNDKDKPPYRAICFRGDYTDGSQDGVWLLKCIPVKRTNGQKYHTVEGETKTVQTVKIELEAIPTIHNGDYHQMSNSLTMTTGFEDWFDKVPGSTTP